jgi:hypothetical protein
MKDSEGKELASNAGRDGNISSIPQSFVTNGLTMSNCIFSNFRQNMEINGLKLPSTFQDALIMQLKISFILA